MAAKPRIVLRADGDSATGLGHVYRLLAIYAMLERDYDCRFCILDPSPAVVQLIEGCGARCVPLPSARPADLPGDAELYILDGYAFDTTFQRELRDRGRPILSIDDIHAYRFLADAVVNHAPRVADHYAALVAPERLHTGLDYAILRPEFLAAAAAPRPQPPADPATFVCFGGSDHHGISLRAAAALLDREPGVAVHLVVGGAFRHGDALAALQRQYATLQVHRNLGADALLRVMRSCTVGIAPASTILYELIAVGLPAVSGYYVGNQERIYEGFRDLGYIVPAGNFHATPDFAALVAAARRWVAPAESPIDGRSPERFRTLIEHLLWP